MSIHGKAPVTRKAGAGFADPDYEISVDWLAAREAILAAQRRHDDAGKPPRILLDQRLVAQRAHLPGRDVEDLAAGQNLPNRISGNRPCRRHPRPQPAHVGIRQADPSVQVLRRHRDAAVPLAVQLLSELCAGPDRRLDERDLSALGRRARHHDYHPGELVSRADSTEGDDRPAGLRRRRQPRSDLDPRQESG